MPWVRDYAAKLKHDPIYNATVNAEEDSGRPLPPPGVPSMSLLSEQGTGVAEAGKWGSAREPQSLAERIRQKNGTEGSHAELQTQNENQPKSNPFVREAGIMGEDNEIDETGEDSGEESRGALGHLQEEDGDGDGDLKQHRSLEVRIISLFTAQP